MNEAAKRLKELEDKIDLKVVTLLTGLNELEELVNLQSDVIQRHTDQSFIHRIYVDLADMLTDRPGKLHG